MTGLQRFDTDARDAGTRLDQCLSRHLPGLSRSQAQRLIRAGRVQAPVRSVKPGALIEPGWTITVDIPPAGPATPEPEALPLEVVHDDPDLAVVNKPAGMVVHPAAGHGHGTLVNALLHHLTGLSGVGGVQRPGIVHRLDRGTSGLMVVAKNDRTHRAMARQFHDREVGKEYLALVWGRPVAGTRIETSIGRDPKDRKKMSSRARTGRVAITEVLDVEAFRAVSLVRVAIHTGRTHQVRVHLSEAGHPLVGDRLYGGARGRMPADLAILGTLDRPALHAARLTFLHPQDGHAIDLTAPLPADLSAVVAYLRRSP
jgi:23S rRNA pseudouridine1911/1915/1917 synthase